MADYRCDAVCTLFLSNLANAHAELGQFGEARRCISEALGTIETTKERWFEAEANRIVGEIVLLSPGPDAAKVEAYFDRALDGRAPTTSKIL